ncbi:MAG TPA: ribokinase [Ktedonobacteraceae bacterium]|nr:ribokinase [Ktedonobacteraceae bacterium]
MPEGTILTVGSLNMDEVVQTPRLPALGETLLGAGSLKLVPGGKGANQAVAMARLGASVMMAGRVGSDPFGEQLIKALQADGIDTRLVVVDAEEASGVAFIFLAPDGDNAIVVATGANMRMGQDMQHMGFIYEAISQSLALVLQLEIPLETVKNLIGAGQQGGVPVILNLAPAQPLPWETLRQVSVLIVNETEASMLSGLRVDSLDDARIVAGGLSGRGIPVVIITLGAQGALLASTSPTGETQVVHQPAPKVQVIDTTAGGDCFAGAFTVAYTEQQSLPDALRFAVYASALKVTKFGAQSGLPTRKEVEAFMAEHGNHA